MSSSRVFPKDAHFTPTSLVQQRILLPAEDTVTEEMRPSPETGTLSPPAHPAGESGQQPGIDLDAVREEAYSQGLAAGVQQVQYDLLNAIEALTDACQKIDTLHRAILEQSRGDLINVAISLSKRILGQELTTRRDLIAATLQAALEEAIASEEFFVTVHPDDMAIAERKAPDLIASIRGLEHLVFKTDKSISRGGCLLESHLCSVDATLESQLAAAREHLEDQASLFNPLAQTEAREDDSAPPR
jgi:flagellar assembly protein FliH